MNYGENTAFCVKYKYPEMTDTYMFGIGKPEQMQEIIDDQSIEILGVVLCERTPDMQDYAYTLKEEFVGEYIKEIYNSFSFSNQS